MKKMINTLITLWTPFECKLGFIASFMWCFVVHLVGGVDEQIVALCILVGLDILTGIWVSFKTHTFASTIATHGLWKKAVMFLIIGLGVLLDTALNSHMIRSLFIGAFSIVEAMSIIENVDRAGYGEYIPSYLRNALSQLAREKRIIKDDNRPPTIPPPMTPPMKGGEINNDNTKSN